MLGELLNHSPDLKRLRDEGYEIAIRQNVIVITNVPYVNSRQEIAYATLVAKLDFAGNKTLTPSTHVMNFGGEYPCRSNGQPFSTLGGPGSTIDYGDGITTNFTFSSKPEGGKYADYYEQITTYVAIFENEAKAINPNATAKTFRVVASDGEDPIFHYPDTNSSRAEINAVSDKLKGYKIAIIGVGGTGSYVLDFIAKTPVAEIHIFDKDLFLAHNAFRSPGAPTLEELNELIPKVEYFYKKYSNMRKHIVPHQYWIDRSNVNELDDKSFVFICIDKAGVKALIIKRLEEMGIPFIDVGMGLEVNNGSIDGILRTTTSTASMRSHIHEKKLIPLEENNDEGVYSSNIQIAELNALNASQAVIRWKKECGFYHDSVREHQLIYSINDNLYHHEDEA